jgi:YHS domain-containing protein
MDKCKLDNCDKQAEKSVELNAEDFTRMEFHIRGPYYHFCSNDHLEQWVKDNS